MNISLFQQTVNILNVLDHTPAKKFGQNFLIDQNIVEKFTRLAKLQASDTVVEIGPGLGTVSRKILSYDVNLHAVELDKRLFKFLKKEYSSFANFHIINGDAIQYPIANLGHSCSSYKIVASLPYAISSAWFDALLAQENLPSSVAIIIQLDTANRFLAKHGTKSFGPISIFIQSAFFKTGVHKISRSSFYPVPKVDSVMLFLERKPDAFIFSKKSKQLIHQIFTNRRKQIGTIIKDHNLDIQSWLISNNIAPITRPEQIPLSAWPNLL